MKTRISKPSITNPGLLLAISIVLLIPGEMSAEYQKPVTIDTFVRAESDVAIKKFYEGFGLSTLYHNWGPIPIDKQTVIRMNRDTLYSSAVIDLTKPATVIMPATGGRYMSLHVINQDHYSYAMTKPGRYELTREKVGTRYAYLIIRTFIDGDDPEAIKAANATQDEIKIEGGGSGPLEIPNWNIDQLLTA